jgi:hypothetical protein
MNRGYHFEKGDKITYNVNADGSFTFQYFIPSPFGGNDLIVAEKQTYVFYELDEATEMFKQHIESKVGVYDYPSEAELLNMF